MTTARRPLLTALGALTLAAPVLATAQDDAPPSTPDGLAATAYGRTAGQVQWQRSTDDRGAVPGYEIVRDGVVLAERADTLSIVEQDLEPGTSYVYGITAIDNAGQRSDTATVELVTRGDTDAAPGPDAPSDLDSQVYSRTAAELFWARPSTFGLSYEVSRDGASVRTTDGTSFFDDSLEGGTTYTFDVVAIDAEGRRSNPSTVMLTTRGDAAAGGGTDMGGDTDTGDDTDMGGDVDTGGDTDTGGDQDGGDVTRVGLIRVSQPDLPDDDGDDGDVFGAFASLAGALPFDGLTASLRPAGDTCTFDSDDDDAFDEDAFQGSFPNGAGGRPFDYVSAGDSLVFTSPAGTWLTLPRVDEPGFTGYVPRSRPLPTPYPSGLVVDVPGDDFPAFSSVAVGDVQTLVVQVPDGDDDIARNQTFRWEAGSDDRARVSIELEFEAEFDDSDTDDIELEVTCSAIDDGEFTLPQDVLDRIPDGVTASLDMTREALTVERQDDAVLFVKNEAAGGR